jgi:hypothetical protein
MKTLARIEVEFPTALMVQRKTYLIEDPSTARRFVEACAVAGVTVLSQGLEHVLDPGEIANDIAKERRIAADLAGNALTSALNPERLLG